jgi:NADP-dependent 3-hydroxy acid dehydrogenase YdfG
MTKTAFITGATSGIGRATAYELAKKGFNLVLCGRRAERLLTLCKNLEKVTKVCTLNFDIRDKTQIHHAIAQLPKAFSRIDVLINNAGNAHGKDAIQDGSLEDWDAMIDINVKGLLYVSKALMPQMIARKQGHIINIGSTAGKEVYPGGNVYCASKHAVDAINKAMRLDLNAFGIKVTAIHPGMVATEFSEVRFKGDKNAAAKVYEGFQPLLAEDIAEIISFALSRPAHVCIADLIVTCTAQATSTVVNKK